MTVILVAVALGTILLGIGLAYAWQQASGDRAPGVVYGVEDALEYVYAGLGDDARARLRRSDIRRILEWEVAYLQNPSLRGDDEEPAVVGGLNAARFTQERLVAAGRPYDGTLILEVLELQAEYLAALGAIGEPVTGEERSRVLDRSGEQNDG